MRTAVFLVLLTLSVSVLAEETKFRNKLTSLLNMKSKAVDAVDSALQLLRDLKQANFDAQAAADEVNRTQEEENGKLIADLTTIADANKATGDDATNHRKHIEDEIQGTQEYLVWINNRRTEINRKREALREHRCYANMAFVKALKEHDEALEVVRWLKEDLDAIVNDAASMIDLSAIKNSAKKLGAYTQLFNSQAMQKFAQLSEDVDPESGEWDEGADDNDEGALELERMGAGSESRDIGSKLIDAVNHLEEHLTASIEDLKQNEIKAAWDLVNWLQDSEEELEHLDSEQATKTTYMDKLLIAIIAAKAHEDKAWEIYFESAVTLNNAIDNLNAIRENYEAEKARRDEENGILDEVIQMFIEKVSNLDAGMRNKVDDHAQDGSFDDSDIERRTDSAVAADTGNLASNIEAEAGY